MNGTGSSYIVANGGSHPSVLTGVESQYFVYSGMRVELNTKQITEIPLSYHLEVGKGVSVSFRANPELAKVGACLFEKYDTEEEMEQTLKSPLLSDIILWAPLIL